MLKKTIVFSPVLFHFSYNTNIACFHYQSSYMSVCNNSFSSSDQQSNKATAYDNDTDVALL